MLRWFRKFRIRQLEKAISILEKRRTFAEKYFGIEKIKKLDDQIHYYRHRIARLKFKLSQ